jgi:hypothetical protein
MYANAQRVAGIVALGVGIYSEPHLLLNAIALAGIAAIVADSLEAVMRYRRRHKTKPA